MSSPAAGSALVGALAVAAVLAPTTALAEDGVACPATTHSVDVVDDLDRALDAWRAMDVGAFLAAADEAQAALSCEGEIVSPELAARLHEVEGLRAFGERDLSGAFQAFAAAVALAPDDGFPRELVPENHPLDKLVMQARAAAPLRLPAEEGARVVYDGSPGLGRFDGLPSVAQRLDPDGAVQLSMVLAAGQSLPEPVVAPEPALVATVAVDPAVDAPAEPVLASASVFEPAGLSGGLAAMPPPVARGPAWGPGRVALATAAGAAALTSGTLIMVAETTSKAYWSPTTATSQLDMLRVRTNRQVIGAGVAGGTAVLAGAGLLLTVAW